MKTKLKPTNRKENYIMKLKGTKTNSQGEYQKSDLPLLLADHKYKVNFESKGYEWISIEVKSDELIPGEVTIRDIVLTPEKPHNGKR